MKSSWSILVALLAVPARALAQDIGDLPSATNPRGIVGDGPAEGAYWSAGRPRAFVAGSIDVGVISARTELDIGFGKPHHAWGGIELWPRVSQGGVTLYAGAKISTPAFEARSGFRSYGATSQHLVTPAYRILGKELDSVDGPLTHYASVDSDVSTSIPLPGPLGSLRLFVSVHQILGIPDDYFVFEDLLRVVTDEGPLYRLRATHLAPVDKFGQLHVGGSVEVVGIPTRDAFVVRTGPVVTVNLTHHLEASASIGVLVGSRDELGLAGTDLGQIALRYRWATGDLWPDFP